MLYIFSSWLETDIVINIKYDSQFTVCFVCFYPKSASRSLCRLLMSMHDILRFLLTCLYFYRGSNRYLGCLHFLVSVSFLNLLNLWAVQNTTSDAQQFHRGDWVSGIWGEPKNPTYFCACCAIHVQFLIRIWCTGVFFQVDLLHLWGLELADV